MDVQTAAEVTHADRHDEPQPEFTDAAGWIWNLTFLTPTAFKLKNAHGFNCFANDIVAQFQSVADNEESTLVAISLVWAVIESEAIVPRSEAETIASPPQTAEEFWAVMGGKQIEDAWLAFQVAVALFSQKPALIRLLSARLRDKQKRIATKYLDGLEREALAIDEDELVTEMVDAAIASGSSGTSPDAPDSITAATASDS